MAVFNEIMDGGVVIAGCTLYTFLDRVRTLYGPGDILYNIDKAKKGVLERVVIKRQRVLRSRTTEGQFQVLYIDTLNALWNEWDLVSHAVASDLAIAYFEKLLDDLSKLECK